MTARRLDAAMAYAPNLDGLGRASRGVPRLPQGPVPAPQPKREGERIPAADVCVGMQVKGLPYWGAYAGRWLRVNAVGYPRYQGLVAVDCEGGRSLLVGPDVLVQVLREEGGQ